MSLRSLVRPPATLVARRGMKTSPNVTASWLSFSKEKEKSTSHSKLLSQDQSVYELVSDIVIPQQWDPYLANKKTAD